MRHRLLLPLGKEKERQKLEQVAHEQETSDPNLVEFSLYHLVFPLPLPSISLPKIITDLQRLVHVWLRGEFTAAFDRLRAHTPLNTSPSLNLHEPIPQPSSIINLPPGKLRRQQHPLIPTRNASSLLFVASSCLGESESTY